MAIPKEELKKLIAGKKRKDRAFAVVGFLSVMTGLATLSALIYTLFRDGGRQAMVYTGTNNVARGDAKNPDGSKMKPGEQAWEIRKLSGDALLDLASSLGWNIETLSKIPNVPTDKQSQKSLARWVKLNELFDLGKLRDTAANEKLGDMMDRKRMKEFVRIDHLKQLATQNRLDQILAADFYLRKTRADELLNTGGLKPILTEATLRELIDQDRVQELFSKRGVEDATFAMSGQTADAKRWVNEGEFDVNVFKLFDEKKLAGLINEDKLVVVVKTELANARAQPREFNSPFFSTLRPSASPELTGILVSWVGSFCIIFVTMLAALPLGIGAGVYLEEYARKNRLTALIEINIANLAGVPSIIYGLMALGFFVYMLKMQRSVGTAGLTLALLVLPIIIMATREAIRAIPQHIREASYACGATRWQTVRYHILPYSSGGILTGSIIGLSRAIGETAPLITIGALTFVTTLPDSPIQGSFPYVSFDWLKSGFTAMPLQIYNLTSRPEAAHQYYSAFHQAAALASILLIVMTLSLNAVAIWMRIRLRRAIKW